MRMLPALFGRERLKTRDAPIPLYYSTSTCFTVLTDAEYLIRPLHIFPYFPTDVRLLEQHPLARFFRPLVTVTSFTATQI